MSGLLALGGLGVTLSVTSGGPALLDAITLAVAPGEVLGLIGESGSGKSLTALAILGLLPPGMVRRGSIRFEGEEIGGLPDRAMARLRGARIGMVVQEPMTALNPLQTIGDQVGEVFGIHRGLGRAAARRAARAVLDRVGLPEGRVPAARYPHELSGGQRQRVGIAIAVALRPRLLICDEPTTALDVTTQAQILTLLRQLVDEDGMGMMFITHDLAVAHGLADRIAVMQGGRIVETGATAALFRDRTHAYTRALFAASAPAPARAGGGGHGTLLRVEGVVRAYRTPRPHPLAPTGRLRAVDGVSLTVGAGEAVGLVGESGSGKSTLARAILGLEPVQGGTIHLGDVPVHAGERFARVARQRMQAVFQDPYGSFNPRHSVGRLVAEPFHLRPDAPVGTARVDAVARTLEAVGLQAGDADRHIHEFSGGQRQRIAIARALVIAPSLILLDEAVSALDVRVRAQILDLLAGLQDRLGLAYLFISHDLGVIRAVTDRVLVMQAGRIVEEGRTADVFAAPSHPHTQALLAATPRLPA